MQFFATNAIRHDQNQRRLALVAAVALGIGLIVTTVLQAPAPSLPASGTDPSGSSAASASWPLSAVRDVSTAAISRPGVTSSSVMLPQAEPAVTTAAVSCYATFTGDASGRRDVTSALTAFLRRYNGRSVCLKYHGVYRIDGIVRLDSLSGLKLNGRGSTLKQVATSAAGSNRRAFYILKSRNVSIGNMTILGRNPNVASWVSSRQNEPGIWIDGGSGIRIHHVAIKNMYGDGIYIGFKDGGVTAASGVTLDHVTIYRVGRNGIGIVAGNNIVMRYVKIVDTGLHGIDLEPDYASANIHHVTVQYSSIARVGRGNIDSSYSFAANGKAGNMSYIKVLSNVGDRFKSTIQAKSGYTHRYITFSGNRSTYASNAYFSNIVGLSFSGNTRITQHRSNVR